MPLAYEVIDPLTLTAEAFNADGLAVITANGARYGSEWAMTFHDNDPAVSLGEIHTAADDRPSMAVDTAYVFVNDACVKNGLKIVSFRNMNDRYPPDQAPYFALAQFVVAAKDWK